MLQPNMPRFVRVGDKANIAASLMNLYGFHIDAMFLAFLKFGKRVLLVTHIDHQHRPPDINMPVSYTHLVQQTIRDLF